MKIKNKRSGCIPKTKFNRVFNNSLDRLNIDYCLPISLISGFKSTEIYHYDENKCRVKYSLKVQN